MLSENLDIMLGEDHFSTRDRDASLNSNSVRRPESTASHDFGNGHENTHVNSKVINPGNFTESDQNLANANSSAEINRLSSELNSRLSRELDKITSSGNTQIERAISDAISNQILPQIHTVLNARSGQLTQNRWNVLSERPGFNPEKPYGEKTKKNPRCEQRNNYQSSSHPNLCAYDMVTGENASPTQASEFLTGRMPSGNHLNQSYDDLNLDTTIPAQDRLAPPVESDPISRLADVLTSIQNRPAAQQLTISPVNSNTMTFDGKNEKFELFEDLFHTMIKMQPEMSEQIKINHFHSLLKKNALQTFRNIGPANLNHRQLPNSNGTVWYLTQTRQNYHFFFKNSTKVQKRRLETMLKKRLTFSCLQNCH